MEDKIKELFPDQISREAVWYSRMVDHRQPPLLHPMSSFRQLHHGKNHLVTMMHPRLTQWPWNHLHQQVIG